MWWQLQAGFAAKTGFWHTLACIIDYSLRIILHTDTSDYTWCVPLPTSTLPNEGVIEEPIRFLGLFHGPQTRWSTIEKEAYAIYLALFALMTWLVGYTFQ